MSFTKGKEKMLKNMGKEEIKEKLIPSILDAGK